MKKMLACAMIFAGIFFMANANARTIYASDVSAYNIRSMIDSQYVTSVDNDGDIKISNEDGFGYIRIINKVQLIRISASFKKYDKLSHARMIVLANKFNDSKRFLRVCVSDDGSSCCDYYFTYKNGVNAQNLNETIRWFFNLKKSWQDYVLSDGQK